VIGFIGNKFATLHKIHNSTQKKVWEDSIHLEIRKTAKFGQQLIKNLTPNLISIQCTILYIQCEGKFYILVVKIEQKHQNI